MVSRRKILSRSRDGLNSDFQDEDDDIWFQKERLIKDHIQEVLNKWKQIDDEIWAKIIVMERNRRVAKAYARTPVLTINGSDDGFDGYRIGLCGFDNPMRDAKTEEIKKHIGHGIKIKMDDGGNIMVKRICRSNIYVKEVRSEEINQSEDTPSGNLLEPEKPVKIFDMKKFVDSVNTELRKAYPDRRKLESKCLSAISFVKDSPEILDCSCWVMIINIVALDMLRTKLPPVSKSSLESVNRRRPSHEEDPYSIPFTMADNSLLNMDVFKDPKPPKLPPRDIETIPVPTPDYDDWKPEKPKNKKPQQSGYRDDPYYCGMSARVPNFGKRTVQHQLSDSAAPVRKSHSSGYLAFPRQGDRIFDYRRDDKSIAEDEYFRVYGRMRSAPSHSQAEGMYVGEWE